jgi:hypothetical protein
VKSTKKEESIPPIIKARIAVPSTVVSGERAP